MKRLLILLTAIRAIDDLFIGDIKHYGVGVYHTVDLHVLGSEDFARNYSGEPITLYRNYLSSHKNDLMTVLKFKKKHNEVYEFEALISNSHYFIMNDLYKLEFCGCFISLKTGLEETVYLKNTYLIFEKKDGGKKRIKENIDYFKMMETTQGENIADQGGLFYDINDTSEDEIVMEVYQKMAEVFPTKKEKNKLKTVWRKEKLFFEIISDYNTAKNVKMKNKDLKKELCNLVFIPINMSLLSNIYKNINDLFDTSVLGILKNLLKMVKQLDDKIKDKSFFNLYLSYIRNYAKVENTILVILIVKYKILDADYLDIKLNSTPKATIIGSHILRLNNLFAPDIMNGFISISTEFVNTIISIWEEEGIIDVSPIEQFQLKQTSEHVAFHGGCLDTCDEEFEEILNIVKKRLNNPVSSLMVITIKKLLQTVFAYSFVINLENHKDYLSSIPSFDSTSVADLSNVIKTFYSVKAALTDKPLYFSTIEILSEKLNSSTKKFGFFYKMKKSIQKIINMPAKRSSKLRIFDKNGMIVKYKKVHITILSFKDVFVIFLRHEDYIKYRKMRMEVELILETEDKKYSINFRGLTEIV
ncbi:hypothetical protein NGRA_2528 [Nosema granulosis]|uniref:Uncharacterized protein n=1 Tax=Nosema granulosis TaxID=83296 RepID=A0A9P6GXH7_9MICR|nr:hypothetical protein NGRA_2528 [Nosema granulosis]